MSQEMLRSEREIFLEQSQSQSQFVTAADNSSQDELQLDVVVELP